MDIPTAMTWTNPPIKYIHPDVACATQWKADMAWFVAMLRRIGTHTAIALADEIERAAKGAT